MAASLALTWSNQAGLSDLDEDQQIQSEIGEDVNIVFTVIGTAVDVTTWTLAAMIAPDVDSSPYKAWIDSDFGSKTSAGLFTLSVAVADTSLLPGRNYFLEIRRVDSGFSHVISKSFWTLSPSPYYTPVTPPAGIVTVLQGGTGADLSATGPGIVIQPTTGAALTILGDAGADKILFWDDSASVPAWLTVGSGLSITGTTLSATASGVGTVTSVSVVAANGISGSVATSTTTPAITLTLGAITPTTVNGLTVTTTTGTLTLAAAKTLTVNNTLTLTGTDGSTLAIGTGGTLGSAAYTASSAYDAAGSAASAQAASQPADAQLTSLAGLSYAGNGLKFIRLNFAETAFEMVTAGGGGDAFTTNPLSQFAATTSAQLAGVISDKTGSGSLVFANSPVFTTPNIGSATGDISGNAATVTTNANLTGPITSVGNATSIASQTGTGTTFAMSASPSFTGNIFLGVGASGAGNLSLSFTGDTNTGLYHSAADEIRVQTGGVDAVTVDANQRVGIGGTPTERFTTVSADNVTTTNIVGFYSNNLTRGIGISYETIRPIGPGANLDLNIASKGTGRIVLNPTTIDTTVTEDTLPGLGGSGGKFQLTIGRLYGLIAGNLGTGNAYFQVQRIDATATAYDLLLQPSGGKVHIGGINPGAQLQVTAESAGIIAQIIKLTATPSAHALDVNSSSGSGGDLAYISQTGGAYFAGGVTLADVGNVALGTSTGTKIGTATGQKLGFWNATPVVQQVFATGGAHTVDELITLLQTLGLCKQS